MNSSLRHTALLCFPLAFFSWSPLCGAGWAELLLQRVDRDVSLREQLLRSAVAGGRGQEFGFGLRLLSLRCCALSGLWEVKSDSEGRDACLKLRLYAATKEPLAFLMWSSGAMGQGPALG